MANSIGFISFINSPLSSEVIPSLDIGIHSNIPWSIPNSIRVRFIKMFFLSVFKKILQCGLLLFKNN